MPSSGIYHIKNLATNRFLVSTPNIQTGGAVSVQEGNGPIPPQNSSFSVQENGGLYIITSQIGSTLNVGRHQSFAADLKHANFTTSTFTGNGTEIVGHGNCVVVSSSIPVTVWVFPHHLSRPKEPEEPPIVTGLDSLKWQRGQYAWAVTSQSPGVWRIRAQAENLFWTSNSQTGSEVALTGSSNGDECNWELAAA